MKPFRAFLFLASTLSLLFLASFLQFEKKGLLKYLPERFHSNGKQAAMSSHDSIATTLPIQNSFAENLTDKDSLVNPPQMKQQLHHGDSGLIFAANDNLRLSNIANKLQRQGKQHEKIRILYYGDSQIEGDQITAALRKILQAHYGGKGPGLVSPELYYNEAHQLMMSMSKNWEQVSVEELKWKNKSVLFKSAQTSRAKFNETWIRINRLKYLHPQEDYTAVRINFVARDSTQFQANLSGKKYFTANYTNTDQTQTATLSFERTPDDLKISFSSRDSIRITGIYLESESGFFVDNISLRGMDHVPFHINNSQQTLASWNELKPDLVALQFGVNVVPYFNQKNRGFEKRFRQQIKILHELLPSTPILIVGVSDMAQRLDGQLSSYPNISSIKQLQYEIAMENGCIFWDLEQFMGGPGSMIKWVDENPPLGRTDYTHFTKEGGEKIGKHLATLLIQEFEKEQQTAWMAN